MKAEATMSRDSLAPARRASDDAARQVRGRLLPAFIALAVLLAVGMAQAWLAHGRRAIAYELPSIDNQMTMIRAEIDQLHIEAESLKALSRVDAVAKRLGFIRPETPPVVIPPSSVSLQAGSSASPVPTVTAGESMQAHEASPVPTWLRPSQWLKQSASSSSSEEGKGNPR